MHQRRPVVHGRDEAEVGEIAPAVLAFHQRVGDDADDLAGADSAESERAHDTDSTAAVDEPDAGFRESMTE